MKKLFVICLLSISNSFFAVAQTDVCGKVISTEDNEPLVSASAIVQDASGKIIKFATTAPDGSFSMHLPSIKGYVLKVSMLGYAKQSISLENAKFPLTILMEPQSIQLKEVAIKADKIREQGDTVTYYVGSFAQVQDRSIGDVLNRMPGINVSRNGKIQYQGEDINKFYIEGSDLLGGKYGVATNGIRHEDIGAIEVLENHQPMQVLSGVSFSSKAAINLKLKDKAKVSWNLHGDAGGGLSWLPEGGLWDGEFFAMAVKPSFQSITTISTNNIGEDLSVYNTDFVNNRKETELERYIDLSLPKVLSLNDRYVRFNRSFITSTNNLWKLKNGEFKFNIDYSYNRLTADASNVTTYFLEEGNQVITEKQEGIEREHSLSGKFIYEQNKKTVFINNTLLTNIDWNNIDFNTTGSLTNTQSAELPDYFISNRFKMIKRFKEKHLVTFVSNNEWESLPQTLKIGVNGNPYSQYVDDYAFYTQESAAYAFNMKGITISLDGGIKGYWRSMNSELINIPEELPGITNNAIHTNSFTTYVIPKIEYWIRKVDITLNLPVSYAHYSFNKVIENHDEAYFSPSLSFTWKPNNRFSGSIRGGLGRSPMNLNMVHSGLIMNNYRTLQSGVDNFYNLSSQNLSGSINYKHTRHGLFANALVMHSWSHLPYMMSQMVYGNYVMYNYKEADNDSKLLLAMGSISKTLDFMSGNFAINGTFTRNSSDLLSQQSLVNSVNTGWSIGGKINGSPCRWLSFDYVIDYYANTITMNETSTPWLSTMTNELSLNIVPTSKWQWEISGMHYCNEIMEDKFKNLFMLDTKLTFKPSKRIELSASLINILNKRHYNYTTYSQLSSFECQRSLRGRQLLFSIIIK